MGAGGFGLDLEEYGDHQLRREQVRVVLRPGPDGVDQVDLEVRLRPPGDLGGAVMEMHSPERPVYAARP